MRFVLLGDTHFAGVGPDRRKDNYFDTQLKKLDQVFDIAIKEHCSCILQVGDFFNSPYTSDFVKAELIYCIILGKRNKQTLKDGLYFYCIFGQHDVFGHTSFTFNRSPLAVLEAAGCVRLLDYEPVAFLESAQAVELYGASFGEDVPKVQSKDSFNVLLVHDMIGDRELYPGQELKGPRDYLRKHSDYDLIVCGDYHYTFKDVWQERTICNPGCMMRKTISTFDLEHKPGVFVFDTLSKRLEWIGLNVQPVEEVFDLSECKKKTDDNSKIVEFIEKLRANNEISSAWRTTLQTILEKKNVNKRVRELLDGIIAVTLEKNK